MAPSNPLDEKTSEVQGSGRTIFYLLKIVGDLIDDELQISDAQKCAGKKVDKVKRAMRVVANASSKVVVQGAQGRLVGCAGADCWGPFPPNPNGPTPPFATSGKELLRLKSPQRR
jgi:hypothetical protein